MRLSVERPDADELTRLLKAQLPEIDHHGLEVEELDEQEVRLRFPFDPRFIGPGNIFSGPTLLGFADTALYAAALAAIPRGTIAVVSTMATTFLKPAMAADVLALSRVISGSRSALHLEAWLFSHAAIDPMMHVTATSVLRAG